VAVEGNIAGCMEEVVENEEPNPEKRRKGEKEGRKRHGGTSMGGGSRKARREGGKINMGVTVLGCAIWPMGKRRRCPRQGKTLPVSK